MSEAEKRQTKEKIDEVVESLESVIEFLKLEYMKLQIKIARGKAELRVRSERSRGE
jgi:hypothetical protein